MEIRKVQREVNCRGCASWNKKGTPMFNTYSPANRGQNIFFCMDCVSLIGDMFEAHLAILEKENKEKTNELQPPNGLR